MSPIKHRLLLLNHTPLPLQPPLVHPKNHQTPTTNQCAVTEYPYCNNAMDLSADILWNQSRSIEKFLGVYTGMSCEGWTGGGCG